MELSLLHKVSIITGASSGIGKATAILFARLGSCIALIARDQTRLEETKQICLKECHPSISSVHKEPFICVRADLNDPSSIEKAFKETINHFKKLDILVNNAGMMIRDTIETFDPNSFDHIMQVNLKSVIMLTNLAVPALTSTKGSIVNISSVCGNRSFPGLLSYCISKAALDQFTKCTALDLAPKGIRVNSVNPGVVVTELQKNSGMSDDEYAQFLERSKQTHALGRPGNPEEVAQAVAFLASSATSFTTGALFMVDGGRAVMCPR